MKPLFGDTSHYLAYVSPFDTHHASAVEWSENWLGRVITTEYVLLELGNALSRGNNRRLYVTIMERIAIDENTVIIIIPASSSLFRSGFDLCKSRFDKDWSITDCIPFW